MDEVIRFQMVTNLVWLPEQEIGYYPVRNNNPYDDAYFDKYVYYEDTEIGRMLNVFRVNLVNKYTRGLMLDIGIGCGTFIEQRGNCLGYDVCPKAIRLLQRKGLFYNPYDNNFEAQGIEGITFFDSLEHIKYPGKILNKIKKQFVFISIPIFRGLEHLLGSRHLKKDEHYYYFTKASLTQFMKDYGFKLLELRDDEIKCGREDIYTFVFRKEK